jgi:hypothetical protein
MNIRSACISVFLLLALLEIRAQTISHDSTAAAFIRTGEIPVEKVYLHLDRTIYSIGDNIWFKAYLVDNSTLTLSDSSQTLYVELISPELKMISRIMIKVDHGTGTGDFRLNDSLSSGNYRIRAYTNWMRNFGDVFFFEKRIVVEDAREFHVSRSVEQEEKHNGIDVQFFPEGGGLINQVNSYIGLKVIDSSGMGCDVKGKVISSLGDSIASFSTTHLGMGSFMFTPSDGRTYYAVGRSSAGIPFKVMLPVSFKTGYTIHVCDVDSDFFCVSVNTNKETLEQFPLQEMIVTGSVRNTLCSSVHIRTKGLSNPVYLSKSDFPEGIARITLLKLNGQVLCERIFYVESQNNCKIHVTSDFTTFSPRQKISLNINTKDNSDIPVPANLSISVVDANQVRNTNSNSDIESYLLLESEVRGNLEQPSYYFDTTHTDRLSALDNLLLTQGWRNYIWSYLSDTTIRFDFAYESGLSLNGNLVHKITGKPIAGALISLILSTPDTSIYGCTTTDQTGRCTFNRLNFTGSANMIASVSDEKSQQQGQLVCDMLTLDFAPIRNNCATVPEINFEVKNAYYQEAEKKSNILKKFSVTDTIVLDEVTVTARKKDKENADGHLRVYGNPDYSLAVTDKMFSKSDILQTLQGRVAGLIIIEDPEKGYRVFFRSADYYPKFGDASPLFLIDGKATDLQTIVSIPVSAVDKVEVLKGGKTTLYGFQGSFGVINVLTKQGVINPAKPVNYAINTKVIGYYQSRIFYEPAYENHQPGDEKPDLRTTLLWQPRVITGDDGQATVSFYAADSKSDIVVDVQGLSESGIPLTGRIRLMAK